MESDSERSLEAESKLNGVLEDEKNLDSLLVHHQKMVLSGDSPDRDRVKKCDSIASTSTSCQDNSDSLLIGGMAATIKMEIENGEKTHSESLADRESREECSKMEMSSKRPKRRASSSPSWKMSRQV